MNAAELLSLDPVIPIATIEHPEDAVPMARAVLKGGLRTLEVTLRTPAALDAIEAIAREVPALVVGAGTVLDRDQLAAAAAAGARFVATPGSTPRLLDGLEASGLPFLCGCSTPSEIAALLERGIHEMKLFPVAPYGGRSLVEALAGPFPGARLCPTGGISADTAPAYLELPNVLAVGGTWITRRPDEAVGWESVVSAARAAARLRSSERRGRVCGEYRGSRKLT
ncbi:MAG: bifunctional 4-hydroxy-2-oxoglutarate aldolase/2-dehydro-3-deoxy-phosphogluconate aldolase [Actinobacteria bacterium]|nr:bifunctional 4-hydroxy-2-oxoglutarate aldolase/2-dehydro-3-deoxy-phosphogluconate aldolase [Actinomycetota bacterium]